VPDAPLALLERFAVPDVLVRDIVSSTTSDSRPEDVQRRSASELPAVAPAMGGETRFTKSQRRDYVRRTSLPNWLAEGKCIAVLGEAGSGKSTVLRCMALDLLTEQGVFSPGRPTLGRTPAYPMSLFQDGAVLARNWHGQQV